MPTARLAPDRLGTQTDNGNWVHRAACGGMDVNLFVPNGQGDRSGHARAICRQCPVTTQCLNDALAAGPDLAGIWAGTSQKQRRAILRGQPIPDDEPAPVDDDPGEYEPPPPRYTASHPNPLKARALEIYHYARQLYPTNTDCYRAIADQLDVKDTTVADWIRKARKQKPAQAA